MRELPPGKDFPVFSGKNRYLDNPPTSEKTNMRNGNCPKCHSHKILRNARVIDRNGDYSDGKLSVRIDRKPEALLFKGSETFDLSACICGECGYAELYAANPAELWRSGEKVPK